LAGSSLLTLLDDIATLLDDISMMGKLAAKKTAGVLGDDLSLNAQQVSGVRANRELPVVWSVAKGSFINKVILVPLALLISTYLSWAITPLLMIGGAFLCYEGVEKVLHSLQARKHKEDPQTRQQRLEAMAKQDPRVLERDKVKGAIRTDFILSAEIVAITLGIVADAPLLNQVLILSGIAILVTIGVYGLVGVIVKLDDMGFWLVEKSSALAQAVGKALLFIAPWLMKVLSVVGTLAMFLVGGGIVVHGISALHHAVDGVAAGQGGVVALLLPTLFNLVFGFVVGAVVLAGVNLISRLRSAS
jgi:uncharacterized protein